jgi:phosphoribulokinase
MVQRPLILGVAGDSAAGKTTLVAGVAALLGADRSVTLRLDDYHRYTRAERSARGITALHPDANDLDLMEEHLRRLAAGQPVIKPVYNHAVGAFEEPQRVEPAPFVLAEGLLGFSTPGLRGRYDLKVFLEPDEGLRAGWKLERDSARRGYTPEQVRAEIERRRPDAVEFMRPQRGWADVVVSFTPALGARLILRPSLPAPGLDDLVARQGDGPPALRLRVGRDAGRLTEILEIDGRLSPEQAAAVEGAVYARRPRLARLRPGQLGAYIQAGAVRHSPPLGLVQLLLADQLLARAGAP